MERIGSADTRRKFVSFSARSTKTTNFALELTAETASKSTNKVCLLLSAIAERSFVSNAKVMITVLAPVRRSLSGLKMC